MSLNDLPVNAHTIAQVHSELRKRLVSDKTLTLVNDGRFPENSKQQFHNEYWSIDNWIFITIGNLYHPQLSGNYNIQIMCNVPKEVWERKPEYEKLERLLTQVDINSTDRNPLFEQMVSRKASEYSWSKGVFHRDTDPMSIKKEALRLKMQIASHVNKLLKEKDQVIDGFCQVMEKALKL